MNKQIVFLCVGTSKLTGDSLAPIVGDKLIEKNIPCFVYGTSKQNVNQKNLTEYLTFIKKTHPNCLLITVDSGVSKNLKIGSVKINNNGINPGGAVFATNYRIGDIGILGVVNKPYNDITKALSSVNMGFILAFGDYIANLIVKSLALYFNSNIISIKK